jgi:hypothetical protein
MSATLNLYTLTFAHGDATQSNNPNLRYADWKRSIQGIAVENPRSEGFTVPAGAESVIFDGTRPTSIDGTTAFDLTLSPLASDRYRLAATGGTAPGFRANRNLNLSGTSLTLTAQANGSLLVVAASGTPFAALQVGDQVLIPGLLTGDASSPFSALNQGLWVVQGAGGASVTLVRNGDFSGATETITPSAAGQFLGFSSAGVQVGDGLDISAGFASPVQRSYKIVAVTATWVEVECTVPLAAQSGITPGASGMQFYTACKRFILVEVDQDAVLRLNGDTGSLLKLSPWLAGDPEQVAGLQKVGPTWKLTITNKSTLPLKATVISAE